MNERFFVCLLLSLALKPEGWVGRMLLEGGGATIDKWKLLKRLYRVIRKIRLENKWPKEIHSLSPSHRHTKVADVFVLKRRKKIDFFFFSLIKLLCFNSKHHLSVGFKSSQWWAAIYAFNKTNMWVSVWVNASSISVDPSFPVLAWCYRQMSNLRYCQAFARPVATQLPLTRH